MKRIDYSKIKLIIWDLDDTLWDGIFAEGKVSPRYKTFELIKRLNKRGIVSSICSKNDEGPIIEYLTNLGSRDDFVFMSINYDNKAPRISSIISKMNLREENCLFVDDNIHNLGEAQFLMPSLMVATPDVADELIAIVDTIGKDDAELSRLNQYKILEKKSFDQEHFFNEQEFLKNSNIQISFTKKFDKQNIQRVIELNERAHQLNYTKKELTAESFSALIKNGVECALVSCKDKYGDYGYIGFYAFSRKNNELIHYFFSCRTLGMHIEQYVYQLLNYPSLTINGNVTVLLNKHSDISYIDVVKIKKENKRAKRNDDILIVGPCDLEAVDYYLPWNANVEFRHYDEQHRLIAYGSHPLILHNALNQISYSKTPFFNPIVNNTTIFDKKYKLVIYSYITALLYGEYENKNTKERIVFGEWPFDVTTDNYSEDKSVCFNVEKDNFLDFKKDYKYIGRVDSTLQAKRIIDIVNKILSNGAEVCLLLGSEIKFDGEKQQSMLGAEIYAKEINDIIYNEFKNNSKVFLINPSQFIDNESDYNGSIQHYSRRVYKRIADCITSKYSSFQKNKRKKRKPGVLYSKLFKRIYGLYVRIFKRK